MSFARRGKHPSSVAKHNANGFAKRHAANEKKNIPKSLDDVYEYTAGKNKRAAIKLTHDKTELVGLGHEDDDDDNEMSGVNLQAIRSRILSLGDAADVINSEEDEEIDSDAAFEESDAEEYAGFSFSKRVSKNSQPKKSKVKFSDEINLNEDESADEVLREEDQDENESGSGEEDEYLDVLDVLDGRGEPYFGDEPEDEKNVEKSTRDTKERSRGKRQKENGVHNEEEEGGDYESEEDEEEDEDEESIEDPFVPSEDDDEDVIDRLDSFIAGLDTTRKRKADDDIAEPSETQECRKKRILEVRTEAGAENEFNVPMTSAPRLELNDLLAPLEKTSALQSLKQSIKPLVNGSALPVPLPLRTREKLDRKAAYEQTKTEINKWDETMKRIKQAEHLSFPLQAPQKITPSNAGLAAKFKPSTEMESAVDRLLRAANLRDDSDIAKTEELKLNHLSVEEVALRRAELQKMRDLMFRAEIKAKRIAKIKSKTYRKIHRKARDKLKHMTEEADGNNAVDEKEERLKHEAERAMERATLRHKNTGKWAKAMQARGELDVDQREEIEEMLSKGERLRRKIQADGDSDGEDEDEDDTSDIEVIKNRAFDELECLDQEDSNSLPQKSKGVFAMKFMQNAMARSAAEVDATADQFREEMGKLSQRTEDMSHEDVEDKDDVARPDNLVQMSRSGGRLVFKPGQSVFSRPHLALSETSSTLKSSVDPNLSPAVASQVTMRSSPPLLNEDIPLIDLSPPTSSRPLAEESNPWLQAQGKTVKTITRHEVVIGKHSDQQQKMKHQMQKQSNKSVKGRTEAINDAQVEVDLNDVLVLPPKSSTTLKNTTSKTDTKHLKSKAADGTSKDKSDTQKQVDAAYEDSDADSEIALQEDHLLSNGKENPKALKQKDLVAMAFAGDNVVEDFAKFKEQEVKGDAPRDEDQTLPGWGSWGGRGVKADPKAKVIKKVPGIDPTARADHGKSHVIISEKKDKKAAKYLVKDLPYPYTSKAQFEKVMNTPVGTEWNSRGTFQKQTLPRVLKKMGTVINPLEKLF